MSLTKKELTSLKEQVEASKEKILKYKEGIEQEEENIKKVKQALQENCDHVIVVSAIDDTDEDDDEIIYHTCVKCGLTTYSSWSNRNDNYVPSLYGYKTKVVLRGTSGEEQYKKYLKENPNITDEELVKRFVKDYKGEGFAKKLRLKKERTTYGNF